MLSLLLEIWIQFCTKYDLLIIDCSETNLECILMVPISFWIDPKQAPDSPLFR